MDKVKVLSALEKLTEGKTDDESLALIAEVTAELDTVTDDTSTIKDEYEHKLQELESMWREKYRHAFFHGTDEKEDPEEGEETEEKEEPETYEDLFKKDGD